MDPTQKGGLSDAAEYDKDTAVAKTSASFGDTVARGMLCNWLVSPESLLRKPSRIGSEGLLRMFFGLPDAMSKTSASCDRCGRRAVQLAGSALYESVKITACHGHVQVTTVLWAVSSIPLHYC